MDARQYKVLTSRPDVFARGELDETARVLRTVDVRLAGRLEALERAPVPKPPRHRGGARTDCFRIDAPHALLAEVVDALVDAEAAAVGQDGETTPEASARADLVDRWTRYLRWCEEGPSE